MKKLKSLLTNEKGFTLLELLAVIVILGIIAAIAVPAIGSLISDTEQDAHESNALSLIEAARLAEASGETIDTDKAPDTWTASELVSTGFLDAVPTNPEDDAVYEVANVVVSGTTYTVTLGNDSDGNSYVSGTKADITAD